ncbi:hypothetical protein, partial [Ferruginibacter sp.]|uniref:hypothetical protein n=1 Tax=Ferruginibacter sp. TaxID=1940288 RepID=UPI00198A8FCB
FIPSLKRWRYLAVNTLPGTGSKNTFQENWMEGQAPGVNGGGEGKGLWITDVGYTSNPGNYDALSFTPSIKWFNGTVYMGIGNPITYDIRSHAAYFTYIRGDRGSTAANGLLSTTVLRTFGNLVQGDKIVNIPVGINGIGTGNPYASAIDLRKVAFSDSNNVNIFVWDPNLGGGYGQGGFQTLSRDPKVDQHFTILPGGGSYGLQSTMNTIESGLGFFIQGSLTSRTLTFKETAKTPSQNILSRTTVVPQKMYVKLSVRDANDSLTMADAFQVRMSSNYNTALDANDARKRTGSFESVASNREGTLLVMEYRNSAMLCNDSLLINSINLAPKNYCWTIINTSLNEPGRTGVLVDKFLGTEMLLNLDSITNYNFTVTGEEGSSNVNRFLVVFRQTAVLQIEHISLAANRMPNDAITLKWTAENETKINHYETQKSTNAVDFLSFGINTVATDNTGGSPNYLKVDGSKNSGDIFYRIKAVQNDMQVTYSTIVKVKALKEEGSILVYPNPVGNKTVMLYFKEIPFGNYHLSLTETTGRTIFKGNILVSSAMIKKEILINKNHASGNYNLEITNKAGFKKSIKVTVVN